MVESDTAPALHPRRDDAGRPVVIRRPSAPSPLACWADAGALARVVPDGPMPAELGGVAFAPAPFSLPSAEIDEPAFVCPPGYKRAAGVVIEEPDGRIWIVSPSNEYAGYRSTFPKGTVDPGASLQATAVREAWEESGLLVELTGWLADSQRSQSYSRYYKARRIGGTPAAMGWETQAVSLVPKAQLVAELNQPVDHPIAAAMSAGCGAESLAGWTQTGTQKGSNPGGVFVDPGGVAWYCKFPRMADVARNEVLAAKLYEAAGVRVPQLKLVTDHGRLGVASRMIGGLRIDSDALRSGRTAGVFEGFAADAWLANWDVIGLLHDNLQLDQSGAAVRLDTGGALLFRAMGEPKGAAFGDHVAELQSLRSAVNPQAQSVFSAIPDEAVADGIRRIAEIDDATIRSLCQTHGPGSADERAALVDRLIARKRDLIRRCRK